jgi:hypothetical protein
MEIKLMALQFQRNADVYIECMDTARTDVVTTWKVPVLEGFSFTQSINSSEITINEAGETSRRARLLFNDSLSPAEWSFSTYIRPVVATNVLAPEQALWAMMFGADSFGVDGSISPAGIANEYRGITNTPVNSLTGATANAFNMNASNISAMPDNWNIVFAFEDGTNKQYFRLNKAVVNSASIDFDIDGIATCAWSGFAVDIEDLGDETPDDTSSPARIGNLAGAITTGTTGTENFIRNRISTVTLNRTDTSPDDAYSIVLTGGSFSIENNISYLTPEELANVNVPLANITGARSVTGSLTCYFDNSTSGSPPDRDKSGELFQDLVADTTTIRNTFDMSINIGGETANTPRLELDLPTAHLEIPTINVEDLLTLEVNFHGQVANGDVDSTNEATIVYKA